MTPCEKLGYKVGDRFEVVEACDGWEVGQIITLYEDDGSSYPLFSGDNPEYNHCDDESGAYALLSHIKPLPKLTKSKQWLADAIHNSGKGWPDGAQWAAQDWNGRIYLYDEKPVRKGKVWNPDCIEDGWVGNFPKVPNWHQTVLSRDEYFSVYPEIEKPAPVCESVERTIPMQSTLDTLMQRWQDAKAATQQAQQVEREAHDAVSAELKRCGWGESDTVERMTRDWEVGNKCVVVR